MLALCQARTYRYWCWTVLCRSWLLALLDDCQSLPCTVSTVCPSLFICHLQFYSWVLIGWYWLWTRIFSFPYCDCLNKSVARCYFSFHWYFNVSLVINIIWKLNRLLVMMTVSMILLIWLKPRFDTRFITVVKVYKLFQHSVVTFCLKVKSAIKIFEIWQKTLLHVSLIS